MEPINTNNGEESAKTFTKRKKIALEVYLKLLERDDAVLLGSKVFIKATATISNDEGSLAICGLAETSEHKGMSAEQTTGTASSYARKYALNGLFLLDETEADADGNAASQPKRVEQKELATIDRIRRAEKAIKDLGGEVIPFHATGKLESELLAELESLNDQFKRLKNK